MSDRNDDGWAEVDDPRLSPEGRRALARMRKETAELKAAGKWKTTPMDDPYGKFSGPFGVDAQGNVLIYKTDEEARRALEERDQERRRSVAEQLRARAESTGQPEGAPPSEGAPPAEDAQPPEDVEAPEGS